MCPGTQILIKVWKDGSPKVQLQLTWTGPYPVILSTHSSQGTRTQLLDSPLMSQAVEENRRTLNTPVSPWEISDTYSGLQMSIILVNTPKIKFLGIRFLRIALKS